MEKYGKIYDTSHIVNTNEIEDRARDQKRFQISTINGMTTHIW